MKRGWCPTVYEPMPTGDGLLVRVKPPGGRLTGDAARRVAAAVDAFGNGIIELTGRGNLQVRGLAPDGVAPFAAAMVEAGLASADAGAERRRNVLVSPLAGDDPTVSAETETIAAFVENLLAGDEGLAGLPSKFSVAVDGGGLLPLAFSADVTVRVRNHHVSWSAKANHPRQRRAFESRGWSAFADHDGERGEPVGFHPFPASGRGAFGLGLPFGQTNAEIMRGLAELADTFGDGLLRASPWRALLIGAVPCSDADRLRAAAEAIGLIVCRDDARLRVFACIGSPGCVRASVPAREDAARFAAAGFEGTLHLSGCGKGCAHPHPATLTLVGDGGRYRMIRNGRAA